MDTSQTSLPSDWSAQLAARLPEFLKGQLAARHSHEIVVARVTAELGRAGTAEKRALRILSTVVGLDYELKTLILRLVQSPEDRGIWHKYLALTLWQIMFELPKLLGPEHGVEGKALKEGLSEVRSDRSFMDELVQIRNTVVAHLGLDDDAPGRIEWSLDSILSERSGDAAVLAPLTVRAIAVSKAVHQLGSALLRKHSDIFPDAKL